MPMRWFVTVHRGETAADAKPVVSTAFEPVVKDVLSSLARHLGFSVTPRPAPLRSLPAKPDIEAER
jgi:hypothetical protein